MKIKLGWGGLGEIKKAFNEFKRRAEELKMLEKDLDSLPEDCFGSEIEKVRGMKYSDENKIDLGRISDVRSALERLKRKIEERKTTPLSISVSKEHEKIESDKKSKITVNVAYKDTQMSDVEQISDAEVVLSPKIGKLSPERGKTDKEGVFVSEYNAPAVTSEEKDEITVSVSKRCYKSAESSFIITILPPPQPITIERTIYDPAERKFVISKEHAWLPNVEKWITEHDPFAYWFVLCITNNTDAVKQITRIEFMLDPLLEIEDIQVEGYGGEKLEPLKSPGDGGTIIYSYIISKRLPLVISAGGGSRRFYVKLDSKMCNQRYEVRGKVAVEGIEAEIRPKSFHLSCARGRSLEDAILKSPETALSYVENQVNHYSPAEVSAIVKGLDIVFEIGRMCASRYPKRADVRSEVEKLKGYLENVEDKLGRSYKDFEMLVREMDAVLFEETVPEDYAERIKRKCLAFPDDLLAKLQRQSIERGG